MHLLRREDAPTMVVEAMVVVEGIGIRQGSLVQNILRENK